MYDYFQIFCSIKDAEAKKTILQIMRSTWPRKLFTWRDIVEHKPKWITDVIEEFGVSHLFILFVS